MSSAPDRSRFPDGFRRDLFVQTFSSGGTINVERGDTLVQLEIPAGTFMLELPDAVAPGQHITLQAVSSLGGSVTVETPTGFFSSSGDWILTFNASGQTISFVSALWESFIGPLCYWVLIQNEGVTLSS